MAAGIKQPSKHPRCKSHQTPGASGCLAGTDSDPYPFMGRHSPGPSAVWRLLRVRSPDARPDTHAFVLHSPATPQEENTACEVWAELLGRDGPSLALGHQHVAAISNLTLPHSLLLPAALIPAPAGEPRSPNPPAVLPRPSEAPTSWGNRWRSG